MGQLTATLHTTALEIVCRTNRMRDQLEAILLKIAEQTKTSEQKDRLANTLAHKEKTCDSGVGMRHHNLTSFNGQGKD